MKIKVRKKHVYGKELTYPACDKSKVFTALVGKTTLTESDLRLIGELGYQIEQVL